MDDSLMEADDKEAFYDGNSEIEFLQYNRRVTKKNDQSRRFRIKTQAKWLISLHSIDTFETTVYNISIAHT